MQDIPREVIALLPIPDVKDMTDGQTRGATCVWGDEQLHSSTAIDLGEHLAPMEGSTSTQGVRLFLRACGACTRRAVLRALHAHAPTSEQCVDDAVRCPEGAGLRRLMREARR
jgi:hypothetical protein